MKSPFKDLPDLVPVRPQKSIRLTLTPDQAVGLFALLDTFIEQESLPALRECLEPVYEDLSDRLNFRAAQ